jgi:hypothetical protein
MPAHLLGIRNWRARRDQNGHRDYWLTWRVVNDLISEGPASAMQCPDIPQLDGSTWFIGADIDNWAFLRPETQCERVEEDGEPGLYWDVTQLYSTRPTDKCAQDEVKDPLQQPMIISGNFVKYTEEITHAQGKLIKTSSHEPIRGPKVEFDRNRPQIKIQQNVPDLQFDLLSIMVDTVNTSLLWNINPRCIKLSEVPWERKFYGPCYVYYTRTLVFDVNWETFDRTLDDEGSRALNGYWSSAGVWTLRNIGGQPPDKTNPTHFRRFIDFAGNPNKVMLNGAGLPATSGIAPNITNIQLQGTTAATVTIDSARTVHIDDFVKFGGVKDSQGGNSWNTWWQVLTEPSSNPTTSFTISLPRPMPPYLKEGAAINLTTPSGDIGHIPVKHYAESDFLVLGIPTSF